MFVAGVTTAAYPSKEDLAEDIVRLLAEEVQMLVEGGAAFIQLDEPVLTELAFAPGNTRMFMCAALAARRDPAEELEFAVSLINRTVATTTGTRVGVHVCRGNWSRDERTLLRGAYSPLAPYLERLAVPQLVLEYATDRAGDLVAFSGKELGLGVVNPRTDTVEQSDQIVRAVERALRIYPMDKLFLNPDCGFGTFSMRPVNSSDVAAAKLRAIAAAARLLRDRFGR
jgi:5-methyltetrahydropteroyltriglutamate--homocysteine methyltransferase